MPRRSPPLVALVLASLLSSCGDDDGHPGDAGADGRSLEDGAPGDGRADDGAGADGGPAARLDDDLTVDPAVTRGCQREAVAPGRVYAKPIECDAERLDGALAAGRAGDLVLRNALAAFVVRTAERGESLVGTPGGLLVDAAATGTEDALKELGVIAGLSLLGPRAAAREVVIRAGGDDGVAVVRVVAEPQDVQVLRAYVPSLRPPPVRAVLDYRLAADSAVLEIEVQLLATRGVTFAPGALALLGGGGIGVGEGARTLPTGEAATASGALRLLAEGAAGRSALALELGEPVEVFRIDSVHLLTAASTTVTPAAVTRATYRLAVGATSAEAREALLAHAGAPPGGTLVVEPDGEGTLVHVEDATGAPVVVTRTRGAEPLRLHVAPGPHRVRTALEARPALASEPSPGVEVPAAGEGSVAAPHVARGALRVRATAAGEPAPVRVTVAPEGSGPLDADALRAVVIGEATMPVPAGRLRVVVSRGPEHDVHDAELDVADGATVELVADLPRVLDTTGWVAGDFHLHSELSTDSTHPLEHALAQMAAEGLEVVASTDHDYLTDYAATAERAGVGAWLVTVVGDELSTSDFGHFGGYPLRRDPAAGAGGAPIWFGLTPAEVFAALRAAGDGHEAVVQVNHPRLDASFFAAVGLDRDTGRATADPATLGLAPGTDLDDFSFDVVEVWNGYTRGGNEQAFEDWLALRAAGRVFGMVGNSDSHRTDRPPGSPRTYLRVGDDARGHFGWDDAEAALRAGRTTVSGGAFVTIAGLDGEEPGDALVATGGVARVRVRVLAPPWIELGRVRLYRGREIVLERALDAGGDPVVRFDEELAVEIRGDTFLVARADGERDAEPLWPAPAFGVTGALDVRLP